MSARAAPESPYKGLNAFEDSELDALLFFGRERETEIVVANLIASRLTVLYGPSGVGKSSLLGAAVARELRALPEQPVVAVLSSWSEDPVTALAQAVREATGRDDDGGAEELILAIQSTRDVYLVLDQAEEYFLYHADDAGAGSFAELLPALLGAPLRVNVLVSLREDSLAKLDRFTGRISGLFSNTLRLDRLDRASARAAIVRPAERYAELTGESVTIEPPLVERVLDEVGAGQIEPALGGLGAVEADQAGGRIEAPYLQLVLQRVWEEERNAGSAALRVETFERLGGAQHIVEEHLEGALAELTTDEKDVAARLFNHLVTPSGTKIAHEVSDLADFGQVSVEQVAPVLAELSERRILRSLDEGGTERFEIFHDVLAEPVLAWRARHRTEREIERQLAESHRRRRRLQWLVAGVLVALGLMTGIALFALDQRGAAREQARDARASGLVAAADAEIERDPELSLLLAREAARISADEGVERSLRQALLRSRLRRTIQLGEPVVAVAFDGGALVAVTEAGALIRVGEDGGLQRRQVSAPVAEASFADDGTLLVTARDGTVRVVRGTQRTVLAMDARGAELSRDGSVAAVVSRGVVRLVSTRSGDVLQTYPHRGARSAAISSDNRRVLTGGADDVVRVWSGQSGRRIHTLTEHDGNAVALAYAPDGDFVASASSDGTARIWRTSDWGLTSTLTGHTNGLTDVAFSSDGEHVVTTGKDLTGRVSHVESGEELYVLAGHRDRVESAAFRDRVGSDLVTGGRDGTVRVWNGVYQPELALLAQLAAPVSSIAVDEDGIRARTTDGREQLLSLATGEELAAVAAPKLRPRRVVGPDGTSATFRGSVVRLLRNGEVSMLRGHRDDVRSVAFSPSGELLVTGSKDTTARVWDVATGELLRIFSHNSAVADAQFSPDGRWVVTAPLRAHIWEAGDPTLVERLQGHEGPVSAAAFTPDSRTVVTGGVDGTVRTYRCELCDGIDALVELADERLAATGRELTPAERRRYLD